MFRSIPSYSGSSGDIGAHPRMLVDRRRCRELSRDIAADASEARASPREGDEKGGRVARPPERAESLDQLVVVPPGASGVEGTGVCGVSGAGLRARLRNGRPRNGWSPNFVRVSERMP